MKNIFALNYKKESIIKNHFRILILFLFLLIYQFMIKRRKNSHSKADITLVTSLFNIKSKFPFNNYSSWVENLLLLNQSIVFFVDKEISQLIKSKRPKIYENKTIWIESSIDDFYTYKNFKKQFIDSFKIDRESSYHTIQLYMVWAEKCAFVKKAIYNNYFHSKYFYWIDAGYFRTREEKFFNNWPSAKKCYEDHRIIMNGIRKLSSEEIEGMKNFNISILNNIIKKKNVGGGFFGGKSEYFLKFIDLYYNAIKKFIKYNLFIGKDQNLFTYVSYLNPKIVKIIYSNKKDDWYYLKEYLSQ